MRKKLKTRLLSIVLLLIVCLSTIMSPLSVLADDYVTSEKNTDDDGSQYFIISGKEVDDLFDFGIKDVVSGKVLSWVFQFKTFTVIKKYQDRETGEWIYKGYWNTPNVQALAKNLIISQIDDGYTDHTYDVNERQNIIDVGRTDPNSLYPNKDTAIIRYGFQLPNYVYNGEYPKEFISVQNILPTSFWQAVWRFIKSLFGLSFIKAPDAENFKTISYWNHEYTDKEESLIRFFEDNWIPYFYNKLDTSQFADSFYYDTKYQYSFYDRGATTFQDLYSTEEQVIAAASKFNSTKIAIPAKKFNELNVEGRKWLSEKDSPLIGLNDKDDFVASRFATIRYDKDTGIPSRHAVVGTADSEAPNFQGPVALSIMLRMKEVFEEHKDDKVPLKEALTKPDFVENVKEVLGYHKGVSRYYYVRASKQCPDQYDYSSYNPYGVMYAYHPKTDKDATELNPNHRITRGISDKFWTEGKINTSTKNYTFTYLGADGKPVFETRSQPQFADGFLIVKTNEKDQVESLGTKENYRTAEVPNIFDTDDFIEWLTDKKTLSEGDKDPFSEIVDAYQEYVDASNKWKAFKDAFNNGKDDKKVIAYNQCLIENEGEDKECWSKKHSDQKTTIAIGNLWAMSGLYKTVDMSKYGPNDKLSSEDAIKILQQIQEFSGPYYAEVISNIIIRMTEASDGAIDANQYIDRRVMPYDTDSKLPKDLENFTVKDPRVEMYKDTFVGGIVSDLSLKLNLKLHLQDKLLNLAGKLSELTIVFQQMINFDLFDDNGLSPVTMWQSAFVTIIMASLALLFIIKTVKQVIDFILHGTANQAKILAGFLVLLLELGLFAALAINPAKTWDSMKTSLTKFVNLGESTVNMPDDFEYLFGPKDDRDYAVLYYIPYLDAWSVYNTGYSLFDDEQLIDTDAGLPETIGLKDDNYPEIANQKIQHWSVLLLDSFEYNGSSTSLHAVQDENGNLINGPIINHNAYRVVDHFLAPRMTIEQVDENTVSLKTEQNENYNGQFQRGFMSLLPKLMNVLLILLLSLIKLLTFAWLWFQLYIFIFKVLLARAMEGKTWGRVLGEVFSPILAMFIIGVWAGICIHVSGLTTGFMAILFEIGLYTITIIMIRYWGKTDYFPATLKPILFIVSFKAMLQRHKINKENREHQAEAREHDVDIDDETVRDPDKYRSLLFNEDGTINYDIYNRDHSDSIYNNWIEHTRDRIKHGEQVSQADRDALMHYNAATGKQIDPKTFIDPDMQGEKGRGNVRKIQTKKLEDKKHQKELKKQARKNLKEKKKGEEDEKEDS